MHTAIQTKHKVAILGDVATQFLVQAVEECANQLRFEIEVHEADYDQITRSINDPRSDLYAFSPQAMVVLQSSEKLIDKFYQTSPGDRQDFAEKIYGQLLELVNRAKAHAPTCQLLLCNWPEINDSVFGNYANSTRRSFIWQLRTLNLKLMELARDNAHISVVDLQSIQNSMGRLSFYDPRFYSSGSIAHSMDAVPLISKAIVDILLARLGRFHKCIVLDLDQTLWGGIIGDDGIENIEIGHLGRGRSFTMFQQWLKELKTRGILLAVCSKNEEKTAKEPFLKHPDMVLRLEDIAVFVANWNNKADNIRLIQSQINIGFDSMIFLDDNPFERNLVKNSLPDVTVPELPEEPSEYLRYLQGLNLFETAGLSENDEFRTQQIQDKIKIEDLKSNFTTEAEFLESLKMELKVEPFTPFNRPRVAQLSQRSNQFNLRTIRYTEEEVANLSCSDSHHCLALSLRDSLADHGLISIIVVKVRETDLFIENWLMSCRVLKRGVEQGALNLLALLAQKLGRASITGEYLPTKKNEMVKDHYRNLGFTLTTEGSWRLNIGSYQPLPTYLHIEDNYD